MPTAVIDRNSLPCARDRVSPFECLRNRLAVVDHLSFAECAGFAGCAFGEVQTVWRCLQVPWAGAMSDAYRWVTEALRTPHPNESCGELDLERALKWKFLFPILLLQKPPLGSGTRVKLLQPIVSR